MCRFAGCCRVTPFVVCLFLGIYAGSLCQIAPAQVMDRGAMQGDGSTAECGGAPCQDATAHVTGTLVLQGGSSSDLTAELCNALDGDVVDRVEVSAAGEFDFGMVPAGEYKLRITGWGGVVLVESLVSADSSNVPIEIRLRAPQQTPRGPNAVSLSRLQHKVPKKAVRELKLEAKALRKGDLAGAIAHLRKAIGIDPDCMEAHNNLGVCYMSQKRYRKAAAEFQKATVLDPNSDGAFTNLATALFLAGNQQQAAVAARQAIRVNPACARAHYMLGEALAGQGKSGDAVIRELERAAPEIPAARLAIAQVLATLGEPKPAAAQLRLYLDTGDPHNRTMVEGWLKELDAGTVR